MPPIMVIATQRGFYDGTQRFEGTAFAISDAPAVDDEGNIIDPRHVAAFSDATKPIKYRTAKKGKHSKKYPRRMGWMVPMREQDAKALGVPWTGAPEIQPVAGLVPNYNPKALPATPVHQVTPPETAVQPPPVTAAEKAQEAPGEASRKGAKSKFKA